MKAVSNIGYRVVSDIERPPAEIVQAFADVPTGNVCDANGRLGAMDYRIKPLDPSWRFAGSAITISARPVDNLIVYQALKIAQPGDVLVITNEEATSSAIIGELVAGMAKNNGIVAIVTDGLVRDLDGLLDLGFPVFACGLCPNGPWKDGPGEVNMPIACGGLPVDPGDIVVGDGDGVVVVRKEDAAQVAADAANISAKERDVAAQIAEGMTLPDWVDGALADKGYAP